MNGPATSSAPLHLGILDENSFPQQTPTEANFGQHYRSDSVASSVSSLSSSASYDFSSFALDSSHSSTRTDSAPPIFSVPAGESVMGISTRSTTARKAAAASFVDNATPSFDHVLQYASHGRSPSTDSQPYFEPSYYQASLDAGAAMTQAGPMRNHRRTRSRADSVPYPQHGEYGSVDPYAGSTSGTESESDWPVSRRSSMSSNGWSHYDPSLAESPLSVYDDPSTIGTTFGSVPPSSYFPNFSTPIPQHPPTHFAPTPPLELDFPTDDQFRIFQIKDTLEKSANAVKSAGTTSGQDRARGAFVQTWLGQSYVLFQEGNVSRHGLYSCYVSACAIYGVKHINSASFGKAVRQKFPNIKTRRLGVRGASRYHYCGIRPSNSEEMAMLAIFTKEEAAGGSNNEEQNSPGQDGDSQSPGDGAEADTEGGGTDSMIMRRNFSAPPDYGQLDLQPATPTTARPRNPSDSAALRQRKYPPRSLSIALPQTLNSGSHLDGGEKTLGGSKTARLFPAVPLAGFPTTDEVALATRGLTSPDKVRDFWHFFTAHCSQLLEAIKNYRFDVFENAIKNWWQGLSLDQRQIVQIDVVIRFIYRAESIVYADVLEYLHNRILVTMPQQVFGALRHLADNMESIQVAALEHFDGAPCTTPKVELAARFAHLITRHLGLCQLAQALHGIVCNATTIAEMAAAWDSIDFEAIKNQCALMSNCPPSKLDEYFQSFRTLLDNLGLTPMESFIRWANLTYDRLFSNGNDAGPATTPPRSLLISFSYVTSQIMRDLTLRSAASFGSFAIANTFLDEYLSFCVLRQVALSPNALVPAPQTGLENPYHPHHVPAVPPLQALPTTKIDGVDFSQFQPDLQAILREQMDTLSTMGLDAHGATTNVEFSTVVELPPGLMASSGSHALPHQLFAPVFTDPPMSSPMRFGSFEASAFDIPPLHPPPAQLAPTSAAEDATQLMEIERFGDLRFDSSPSASGSPAAPLADGSSTPSL